VSAKISPNQKIVLKKKEKKKKKKKEVVQPAGEKGWAVG
jgi:hypothetical protein